MPLLDECIPDKTSNLDNLNLSVHSENRPK
jgi:hypothetical protein